MSKPVKGKASTTVTDQADLVSAPQPELDLNAETKKARTLIAAGSDRIPTRGVVDLMPRRRFYVDAPA